MRSRATRWTLLCCALGPASLLTACSKGPPTRDVHAAITRAVLDADRQVYDAGSAAAEVDAIAIGTWRQPPGTNAGDDKLTAVWEAEFRARQPLALVEQQIDDTRVVRVLLPRNGTRRFQGNVTATRSGDAWQVDVELKNDPWPALLHTRGRIGPSYKVERGEVVGIQERGVILQPLPQLAPFVLFDSAEHRALREARQKRELERAAAAKPARIEDPAAEQRLRSLLDVFDGTHGAVLHDDGGPALGMLLSVTGIDELALRVTGTGVDLSAMPFRTFEFTATVQRELAAVAIETSLTSSPMLFKGDGTVQRAAGRTLARLDAEARKPLADLMAMAAQLREAPPIDASMTPLDAAAAAELAKTAPVRPLRGTVLRRGRPAQSLASLLDPTTTRSSTFAKGNPIAVRLAAGTPLRTLYWFGGDDPSAASELIVNGRDRIPLPALEPHGAAVVTLAPGSTVLELRLEPSERICLRAVAVGD